MFFDTIVFMETIILEKNKDIHTIFHRYLHGDYSREDVDNLVRYFELEDKSEDLALLIADELGKEIPDGIDVERISTVKAAVGQRLKGKVHPKRELSKYIKVAAAVLLAACLCYLSYRMGLVSALFQNGTSTIVQVDKSRQDVLPGGNRAMLILSDGKEILLSDKKEGIDASGEKLAYSDGEAIANRPESVSHATLTTPRGGQYRITLPDGSKVWLNSESSLHYPTEFLGKERKVELKGEAYFEVAKRSNQPFIVKSGSNSIEVLGTKFNLDAYGDVHDLSATLVEGAVRVWSGNAHIVTLKPAEQAVVDGTVISINPVNPVTFTAWKDGLIILNNYDLQTVIKHLERWYDVEFVGASGIKANRTLSGELPNDIPLSEVLRALEIHTDATFRIEGRRVMVNR